MYFARTVLHFGRKEYFFSQIMDIRPLIQIIDDILLIMIFIF